MAKESSGTNVFGDSFVTAGVESIFGGSFIESRSDDDAVYDQRSDSPWGPYGGDDGPGEHGVSPWGREGWGAGLGHDGDEEGHDGDGEGHDGDGREFVTAVVGGTEYVVGGWGEYEVDRRAVLYDAGSLNPVDVYGGRNYIYAPDAVESIVRGGSEDGRTKSLREAVARLALVMKKKEPKKIMAGYLYLPPITSWHVEDALVSELESDSEALGHLRRIFDALEGRDTESPVPPPLPEWYAPLNSVEEVKVLESEVVKYIGWLEKYRAQLETRAEELSARLA